MTKPGFDGKVREREVSTGAWFLGSLAVSALYWMVLLLWAGPDPFAHALLALFLRDSPAYPLWHLAPVALTLGTGLYFRMSAPTIGGAYRLTSAITIVSPIIALIGLQIAGR